jgi:hypothetical protein
MPPSDTEEGLALPRTATNPPEGRTTGRALRLVPPPRASRPRAVTVPPPRRRVREVPPVVERGFCQRCGEGVIACWDASGRRVPVHPVAVRGGELIINASQGRIVQALSPVEVAAARRRGELGFVAHDQVCRALGRAAGHD